MLSLLSLVSALMMSLSANAPQQNTEESLSVQFEPGTEGSKLAPRYSPKGTQVVLVPQAMPGLVGFDHRAGRIKVGPAQHRGAGQLLVLARSTKDKPYDLLFLDANHDGDVADDKPMSTTPRLVRDSTWSSFSAALRVNHAVKDQPAAWEDYPVSFWAVVEKPEQTPEMIRFSRRGFLVGAAKAGEAAFKIVLSDSANDAQFGPGDWWDIQLETAERPVTQSRPVGDYAWAGGKAWKLELEGTSGRQGRLTPFDPGITEQEDLVRRDGLREDRLAVRAAKPVPFRSDIDAAVQAAIAGKQPYFLKFETVWCGPCKQMDSLVFTAQDVADAASGVVSIKVDGDQRKDLAQKHNVKGYPTGILFGADGQELARYIGYQSVKETTAFLQKLGK